MAKRINRKKTLEVQKFGGTEALGNVRTDDKYELSSIEVNSKTKLQDDPNEGGAAIIRRFEFGLNPQAWIEGKPTKQDIFNSHLKGIELMLWRDGMKVLDSVQPRIVIDEQNMRYYIYVGAKPQRGHILTATPRPLVEQLGL